MYKNVSVALLVMLMAITAILTTPPTLQPSVQQSCSNNVAKRNASIDLKYSLEMDKPLLESNLPHMVSSFFNSTLYYTVENISSTKYYLSPMSTTTLYTVFTRLYNTTLPLPIFFIDTTLYTYLLRLFSNTSVINSTESEKIATTLYTYWMRVYRANNMTSKTTTTLYTYLMRIHAPEYYEV